MPKFKVCKVHFSQWRAIIRKIPENSGENEYLRFAYELNLMESKFTCTLFITCTRNVVRLYQKELYLIFDMVSNNSEILINLQFWCNHY